MSPSLPEEVPSSFKGPTIFRALYFFFFLAEICRKFTCGALLFEKESPFHYSLIIFHALLSLRMKNFDCL